MWRWYFQIIRQAVSVHLSCSNEFLCLFPPILDNIRIASVIAILVGTNYTVLLFWFYSLQILQYLIILLLDRFLFDLFFKSVFHLRSLSLLWYNIFSSPLNIFHVYIYLSSCLTTRIKVPESEGSAFLIALFLWWRTGLASNSFWVKYSPLPASVNGSAGTQPCPFLV